MNLLSRNVLEDLVSKTGGPLASIYLPTHRKRPETTHFDMVRAFAFLAPGPILGIVAMMYLKRLPEARLIASGKG